MGNLYEADIFAWSERQADLLRRRARGEPVNETEIDWPSVAEEIESAGRNELRASQSLLEQALLCILKAEAWPASPNAPTWRSDAILFRHQAADAFTPSMARHIDVEFTYRRALRALPEAIDGRPPLPVPAHCGLTLEQLLAEEPEPSLGD